MNDNEDKIIDAEIVENLPSVIAERSAEGNGTDEHTERMRKWSEEWWETQGARTQYRRCAAHSTRTGERCKNAAMQGGTTVCRFHGGAAPQVKRAARARLEMAADRMAQQLLALAMVADSETVQLGATNSALDRAIGRAPTTVEIGPAKPYEEVFEGISTLSREESRAARRGYVPDLGAEPSPPPATAGGAQTAGNTSPIAGSGADEVGAQSEPTAPVEDAPRAGWRREPHDQRPARHVVGDAAMRVAGQLAREQLALESGHKRYKRP